MTIAEFFFAMVEESDWGGRICRALLLRIPQNFHGIKIVRNYKGFWGTSINYVTQFQDIQTLLPFVTKNRTNS
jgi:hypothetical protein